LRLQILIELPVDAVKQNARAVVAGHAGGLDDRFPDVTGRFRVGDVRSDQRDRGLRRAQAGHCGGESLTQTHD
jgi:hypothetical protein